MVILVKRIKIDFEHRDFKEINELFKKAIESIPSNEFIKDIHLSRDSREEDREEYLLAVLPQFEGSRIRIEGFETIGDDCDCKTCLWYAGAYTHDFIRGTGGKCFADGSFRAPFEQCELYKNKQKEYEEYHAAIKEAEEKMEKKVKDLVPGLKKDLEHMKKDIDSIVEKTTEEKNE